jgi:hypothetical protein
MSTKRNFHHTDLDSGMSGGAWVIVILLAMGGILLAIKAPVQGPGERQSYVFLR